MMIWEYIYCGTKEFLVYTQEISCACTTLLCMLWARDPRGQGPKKGAVQGPGPAQRSLAPGPWPLVPGPEHAQECCACTRDLLCIHKRFFCVYTINAFSYYHIISWYYIIWLYPPPCRQARQGVFDPFFWWSDVWCWICLSVLRGPQPVTCITRDPVLKPFFGSLFLMSFWKQMVIPRDLKIA